MNLMSESCSFSIISPSKSHPLPIICNSSHLPPLQLNIWCRRSSGLVFLRHFVSVFGIVDKTKWRRFYFSALKMWTKLRFSAIAWGGKSTYEPEKPLNWTYTIRSRMHDTIQLMSQIETQFEKSRTPNEHIKIEWKRTVQEHSFNTMLAPFHTHPSVYLALIELSVRWFSRWGQCWFHCQVSR